MTTDECVWLRPVQPCDLPRMYDMQLDPVSNHMAVTIPRTSEACGRGRKPGDGLGSLLPGRLLA